MKLLEEVITLIDADEERRTAGHLHGTARMCNQVVRQGEALPSRVVCGRRLKYTISRRM